MDISGADDDATVRADFDTDEPEPGLAVAEAVAELKGVDPTELSAIYDCIDNVLDHVFSEPPAPDANVEIAFTYEGYRVTIRQDGTATFVPTSDSV